MAILLCVYDSYIFRFLTRIQGIHGFPKMKAKYLTTFLGLNQSIKGLQAQPRRSTGSGMQSLLIRYPSWAVGLQLLT